MNHGWKPGQSGNPSGRKRGLERELRDALSALAPGGDAVKAFAARLYEIALSGDHKDSIASIKLAFERGWGLPKQTIAIEDDNATPGIDWSKVSVEQRRALLRVLLATGALDGPAVSDDGPTEH